MARRRCRRQLDPPWPAGSVAIDRHVSHRLLADGAVMAVRRMGRGSGGFDGMRQCPHDRAVPLWRSLPPDKDRLACLRCCMSRCYGTDRQTRQKDGDISIHAATIFDSCEIPLLKAWSTICVRRHGTGLPLCRDQTTAFRKGVLPVESAMTWRVFKYLSLRVCVRKAHFQSGLNG